MKKTSIRISTAQGKEFSTEITINREKYLVQTDLGSSKRPVISTRVYQKGSIVDTLERGYADLADHPEAAEKLALRMRLQHDEVVEKMQTEKRRIEISLSDYLANIRKLIDQKRYREALSMVEEKNVVAPHDPFLLSYEGYLRTVVHRDHRGGIQLCKKALEQLKKTMPFGQDFFLPILYMNLGKTCLAAGRKKEALEALQQALLMDHDNRELKIIMKELGIRKTPPIPFLERSNILNRYIGKMLHPIRKS